MLKIKFPFINNQITLKKYLLENGFESKFSYKYKAYYKIIRPLIPISVRQKIQWKLYAKTKYQKNFIEKDFVDIVRNSQINKILNFKYYQCYNSTVVLTHDVEGREGFNFIPKIIELEAKYGFKSSWNIVPYKYKIDEGIIRLIQDNMHEIGIHGYNHDGKLYYSEKIFNTRVPLINDAIKKYNAVGFRSPMVHRNLQWLQKLNIEYDASCFDYDPFQSFPGGTGSIWPFIVGKFVEIPYTLPQDHTIFYILKQKDISIWKNKADWIAKNHGVILSLTHPDYLIRKKHLEMYEELLDYLKSIENTWKCLPKELVAWWKTI